MDDLERQFGVGLRPWHYPDWLRHEGAWPILEFMADNYLGQTGGPALAHLTSIRARTRLVMHGVGLNIGSPLPLRPDYLKGLKTLIDRFEPEVVSDHFCFSRTGDGHSFDLLPLPRTRAMMQELLEKLDQVQTALGRRIALENVSSYVEFRDNEQSELSFLSELATRSGCGLLLDVNNVFVSAHNHGFDAWDEIQNLRSEQILQYHIAGHLEEDEGWVDTHDQTVKTEVWALLARSLQHFGSRPIILERDDESPLADLLKERADGLTQLRGLNHD